jgi:hypothetical protein
MGKFYENLDDLNKLIKKFEKRDEVAIFLLRAIAYAKDNPTLSVHEIIKTVKDERFQLIDYQLLTLNSLIINDL